MNQQDVFASAQMIAFSPVAKRPLRVRTQYFLYLRELIRLVKWQKRKYTKAQLAYYREHLCDNRDIPPTPPENFSLDADLCYLLLFDLAVILGFHSKVIRSEKAKIIVNKIISDFKLPKEQAEFFFTELDAALGNAAAWKTVLDSRLTNGFKRYLKMVRKNLNFMNTKPYGVLITATMSAGKSTLINSLVGKDISLTQNMTCTSKIHTVISKPFEDGVTSKYDHDLSMEASKDELFHNSEINLSDKITVGTYFLGELAGKRMILYDSPGVNSSENTEHARISQRMIESRKYRLMIYVLNATQLGTTDEERHLESVRKRLRQADILFVLNKTDKLISEEDDFLDSLKSQRQFLVSKGFRDPLICPVSSRAAYLAKKSRTGGLSRIERGEMENYMDKFEAQRLSDYYEKTLGCLPISAETEVDELLVNCGFAYFEKIIADFYNGGKAHGTGIC